MNSLVYVTRCCTDLTSKVLKERTFGQSSAVLLAQHCFYATYANSADPDQTLHNAVSDQDLHCLLREYSIKNLGKWEKFHRTALKFELGWSYSRLPVWIAKSIWLKWVNKGILWIQIFDDHLAKFIKTS